MGPAWDVDLIGNDRRGPGLVKMSENQGPNTPYQLPWALKIKDILLRSPHHTVSHLQTLNLCACVCNCEAVVEEGQMAPRGLTPVIHLIAVYLETAHLEKEEPYIHDAAENLIFHCRHVT